jgi:hypothetical protein
VGDVTIVGNLRVTGIKAAALKRRQGGQQLVYCVESPESWLEDFGEAELVNGRASVRISHDFKQAIDTRSYHVFVSAYGPQTVFVSRRSRDRFELKVAQREAASLPRSVRCSYRIVARRRSVKAPRMQRVAPARMPKIPQLGRASARSATTDRARLNRLRAATQQRRQAVSEAVGPLTAPVFPRIPKTGIRRPKLRKRRR